MMKNAIRVLGPVYNTNRMLHEYVDRIDPDRAELRFGQVVTAVEWSSRSVTIHTSGGADMMKAAPNNLT